MYGHMGATGTVLWMDPDRDAFAVILTTEPQEPHGTYLASTTQLWPPWTEPGTRSAHNNRAEFPALPIRTIPCPAAGSRL